jgi:mycoredoxin
MTSSDLTTGGRVTLFGTSTCSDCRRSRALLDSLGVDYDDIDIELSPESADRALAMTGRTSTPVILFPDGTHQVEPSDAELRSKLEALSII